MIIIYSLGQGGVKYENKENNHVVYFPLVLLCAVVCDCCFTVELEKKPVKLKVQEIIWEKTPKAALYA